MSMLTTAQKTAMQVTLNAAKRAVPDLIAHNVASSIVSYSPTFTKGWF